MAGRSPQCAETVAPAGFAATLENASPLTLGAAAPDTVVDALGEGVFEAGVLDGAGRTDASGHFDSDAIAGKEQFWGAFGTVSLRHPIGIHGECTS